MGRGRGKGKKQTFVANDYSGSGSEDSEPAYKRRGRLHERPLKDDKDDGEVLENEDGKDINRTMLDEEERIVVLENGKKRKRYLQLKQNSDEVFDETLSIVSSQTEDTSKTNGFRHRGSKRKNKPCRAAEAGLLNMGL
ncbi:hypothetical protein HPP92_007465 [Vanilla planifolia]|uniref:Uncharacterized protein n=1 Tax=Vanilla planifolia TaxID=51239 RepID=A0A835RGQ3_VANPL|nr:hypothetical protein HPP92_007465 [Vanilla planifolia]